MYKIFLCICFIIFLIVIYYFFFKPIYEYKKLSNEIFRIYKLFIEDKKTIIRENLYEKESSYCYEFFEWEEEISNQFDKEFTKDFTKEASELYNTLKEYERWRNKQNRGRS